MKGPSRYPTIVFFGDEPVYCVTEKDYSQFVKDRGRLPRGYEPVFREASSIGMVEFVPAEESLPESTPVNSFAIVPPAPAEPEVDQATRQVGRKTRKVKNAG